MRRRQALGSIGSVLLVPGCLDGRGADTPTTEPPPGTPTQAGELGTIEYTVTNEDDVTHDLEVRSVNADGNVVQETFEPEFGPGESVSSGDAGLDPGMGPFTLTFAIASASATYEWDVTECARVDLRVTITDDSTITVEETLCQN